jgi:Fe-S-cluster containining protein
MGYYDAYFTETDPQTGVKTIRKICGKCVFHENGLCEIYQNRPERCKLYPLSYDGDARCVTLDDHCRHSAYYEVTESMKKQMESYVNKLRDEILWRKKTGVML